MREGARGEGGRGMLAGSVPTPKTVVGEAGRGIEAANASEAECESLLARGVEGRGVA